MNNIISFIKSSRIKLNMIIIFSWFFKIIFLSGIISSFIILISNIFKFKKLDISILIILIFVGGITGIIIGWSKRINILSTSRWLDDYLKNNDILSAALFCIERKNKGIFDNLIIGKADKILMNDIKIKWPTKEIKKYLLLCLISGLASVFLLLFWNPIYKIKKLNKISLNTNIERSNEEIKNNKEWFFKKEETPEDLAKFLFPENQKLTELAEDAISKGDIETLNQLFQKEFSKYNELIKNAKTKKEKEKLKEKQEEQNQLMQLLNNQEKEKENRESKTDQSTTMLYKDEKNEGNPADRNKNTAEQPDEKGSQKQDQNSIIQNSTDEDISEKEDNLMSGTKQSDTGTDDQKKMRDEIIPDNNNDKLLLKQKKDSPEFTFLLPDKDTHIPLKDVIINSQRSDESAVLRKGIPIEYEDFVRSYFISLLEEMKNKKINEEDNK